jgi:hypothetical protein
VPVTFDEVRMEVRIARYLSSQSVQLEVAHHFYYQGVRVVKGRWTFLVVSDQTANHLIMHGISGSVQCRE